VWLSDDTRQCGIEFTDIPPTTALELRKIVELSKLLKREKFSISLTVFLKDTNAEGNVYFARYFEWQGMAREAFFRKLLPGPAIKVFMNGTLRLITVEASIQLVHELRLYDEVDIRVRPLNVRHTSVDLEFSYAKNPDGETIAVGKQTIAFSDSTGTLVPIPREVLENGRVFLSDADQIKLLSHLVRS